MAAYCVTELKVNKQAEEIVTDTAGKSQEYKAINQDDITSPEVHWTVAKVSDLIESHSFV